MFGVAKKALLQSLPYAAAVLVLAPRLWRGPDRAAVAFCALFIGLGILPFAFGRWHGGASTNMRYFLSLVPVLAILTAVALRQITDLAKGRSAYATVMVLVVGVGALAYGAWRGYPLDFTFQYTLSNAVILAVAGLSVLTLVTWGRVRGDMATMLRGLVVFGLMAAFFSAWYFDLRVSQNKRSITAGMAELSRDLPEDALVVSYSVETAGFWLNRPPALTAQADFLSAEIGAGLAALVTRALAEGRPVFAQGRFLAGQMVAEGIGSAMTPRYGIVPDLDLYQLTPPNSTGAGQQ
jgi:hypothetical protein